MIFAFEYDPTNWVASGATLAQTVQQQLDTQRSLIARIVLQAHMTTPKIERVGLYTLAKDHWELAFELSPLVFTLEKATMRAIGYAACDASIAETWSI